MPRDCCWAICSRTRWCPFDSHYGTWADLPAGNAFLRCYTGPITLTKFGERSLIGATLGLAAAALTRDTQMLGNLLLWIDAGLNLLLGVGLIALPPALLQILGLPVPNATLYPRIFGGVLVGIAVALAMEAVAPGLGGLGIGGAVAINLCAALVVIGCLFSRQSLLTATGRIVLWSVVVMLGALSALELFIA